MDSAGDNLRLKYISPGWLFIDFILKWLCFLYNANKSNPIIFYSKTSLHNHVTLSYTYLSNIK